MIITLCGSMRNVRLFDVWNKALSLAGHCVFSVSSLTMPNWSATDKMMLDMVHQKKISISDAILVLNKDAYIGDSTLREIDYAVMERKNLYALESWGVGKGPKYSSGSPIDTTVNNGFSMAWDLFDDLPTARKEHIVNFVKYNSV